MTSPAPIQRRDNSTSTSTDTIKNIVNVVARENLALSTEEFSQVLAQRYLDLYPQVTSATVLAHETKWNRLEVDASRIRTALPSTATASHSWKLPPRDPDQR